MEKTMETKDRYAVTLIIGMTRMVKTNEKGEIVNVNESWDVDTGNGSGHYAEDLVDAVAKIVKSLPLNDWAISQLINQIQKK